MRKTSWNKKSSYFIQINLNDRSLRSLRFFNSLKIGSGSFFVFNCNSQVRHILAKFRLGAWLWRSEKIDNVRICPLCKQCDGHLHFLLDCPATTDLRETFFKNVDEFNIYHVFNVSCVKTQKTLYNFIQNVFVWKELRLLSCHKNKMWLMKVRKELYVCILFFFNMFQCL